MPVLFIDFEASGLGPESWPIEIGFAGVNGVDFACSSKLIRPDPSWDEGGWDPISAEVHGIPREDLDRAEAADLVAAWAVERTGARHLISDAPDFDQRWLDRLLDAGWNLPELRLLDFDQAAATAFDMDGLRRVYAELDRPYEGAHRAGPDALRLARAWAAGLGRARLDPDAS